MRITLVCPSRGRPQRFLEMVESAFDLAQDKKRVSVKLGIDLDDPSFPLYTQTVPHGVSITSYGERKSCPWLMNDLGVDCGSDLIVAASDDIIWRTADWDAHLEAVYRVFDDRIMLTYFNDGRDRNKVEHFAVSREWVSTVGYFMWPHLKHFAGDTWNERIAEKIDRKHYLRHVVAEHMHYKYGKASEDASYKEKRAENWAGMDTKTLEHGAPEIARAAERLKRVIDAKRIRLPQDS